MKPLVETKRLPRRRRPANGHDDPGVSLPPLRNPQPSAIRRIEMSHTRFSVTLLCVMSALAPPLLPAPAAAQIVVKNEDVTFKFGVQGQLWADWTQDSTGTQGYQQNYYLRRARLIFGGD